MHFFSKISLVNFQLVSHLQILLIITMEICEWCQQVHEYTCVLVNHHTFTQWHKYTTARKHKLSSQTYTGTQSHKNTSTHAQLYKNTCIHIHMYTCTQVLRYTSNTQAHKGTTTSVYKYYMGIQVKDQPISTNIDRDIPTSTIIHKKSTNKTKIIRDQISTKSN